MTRPIIEMQGLSKRYQDVVAVDGLTLSINRGEVFGLLGPNGAGKTTTTLMLLGLSEPTAGSAFISGIDCTRNPIQVKRQVGYLPDNVGFYPDMTGRENLRLTGRINGLSEKTLEARIDLLLERVGMTEAAERKTSTYSKGMKQRLGLADILMKDPDVLIMDEPTNGIDPEGMRELMALIRELAEKEEKTILISSHQLYQIQQICDRVGIFVKGRLVACGSIGELGEQMEKEYGYRLEMGVQPRNPELLKLLKAQEGVLEVTEQSDYLLIRSSENLCAQLVRTLTEAGYEISHVRQRGGDLDEIYARYFEKEETGDAGSGAERKHAKRLFGKKA